MATVFEASAPIAMFRRPYTTTSSVSYPLPTPTALAGLLAAIAGYENGSCNCSFNASYWDCLKGTRVAVRILAPLRWHSEVINFWNTKNPAHSAHVQIKHQFIYRPHYRVYVHGGIEEEVKKHIAEGTFVFTPYLGTAYAIAEIRYCGHYEWEPVESESVEISSVLPQTGDMIINILSSGEVFREQVPFCLSTERALMRTITVYYQKDPERKLYLEKRSGIDVTRCGDDLVAWFPEW